MLQSGYILLILAVIVAALGGVLLFAVLRLIVAALGGVLLCCQCCHEAG